MKTHPSASLHIFSLVFLLLCSSFPLRAEQFGSFTYRVVDGSTVEITAYPQNAVGPFDIPAQIVSKPVTSIGSRAFSSCTGLTSVTIPSSVTSIGDFAFADRLHARRAQTLGNVVGQLAGCFRQAGRDAKAEAVLRQIFKQLVLVLLPETVELKRVCIDHGCIPFAFNALLRA